MGVVEPVQMAVRGLLPDEAPDGLAQCLVLSAVTQVFGAFADRVDEKLLAHRKTHRQGIAKRCPKRIAAVPVTRKTLRQIDPQSANREGVAGCVGAGGHGDGHCGESRK